MHLFRLWLLFPTKLSGQLVKYERVHPYPLRLHQNFLRVYGLVQSLKVVLWNLSLFHQLLPQGSGQVRGPTKHNSTLTNAQQNKQNMS